MRPAISKDRTPTLAFFMAPAGCCFLGVDGVARTESMLVDMAVFTLISHVSRAIGNQLRRSELMGKRGDGF